MGLAEQGSRPVQSAPYVAIANLTFESLKSFQGSFGANAAKISADLPNFTNVQPLVQISEVIKVQKPLN
ncbi:EthD family reductase [Arenibacter sp. M-2]|uniref:EthD family reductase n=1 Tax=Arenibacter sp. ARW7G5Y1 TaxID=2135619 RepID=UPI0021AD2067|nr:MULTISPECIES: EthD family reductase [unclassified Arenibacter]MDL5511404.1 EthD family reductase [Arenibacter sp. M-2]